MVRTGTSGKFPKKVEDISRSTTSALKNQLFLGGTRRHVHWIFINPENDIFGLHRRQLLIDMSEGHP